MELTMNYQPLISTPTDQSSPLNVVGTHVTLISSLEQTRDMAVTRHKGDPGMGPPPHTHPWDETFYVTSGSAEFIVEGQTKICEPGSLIYLPAGTLHGFSYGPEGGEMLEITGRGTKAPRMFTDMHEQIPPGPPDVPALIEVLGNHGVKVFV
jgi:quercetin dioxygenase-like cupin family protein